MKYLFIFLSSLLFSQSIENFRVDLSEIEKQHLENNFEWNINYINRLIDEKKYKSAREIFILESYKVSALVQAQEYEVAIDLSDKLLKKQNRPPEMVLKLRIQRSLVYEILLLLDQSTYELRQAELLLRKYPDFKDLYYAEFLVRSASLQRIKGNSEISLNLAKRAKIFSDYIGDHQHSAEANMLIAFYYRKIDENSPKFLELYSESLKSAKLVHNNGLVIAIYLNMSSQSLKRGLTKEAMIYVDSADALINKNGDFYSQSRVYQNKSQIFEELKRYDSSLFYLKKFDTARDRLNEAGQKIKISELDRISSLQREIKEKENIQKNLITTKKFNNRLILLISALAVALAALVAAIYLLTQRRNKILVQKEKINLKNTELSQLLKQKEFLVQELNHRVKNNLAAILSLVQLQTEETDVELHKNNFKKLYERIHTISIGHHLYSYSHNYTDTALINLKIYTDRILTNKKNSCPRVMEITNTTDDILLSIDTTLPVGLILNELISNSEKHARLMGTETLKIHLSIQQKGDKIEIIYEDNGTYFDDNKSSEALGIYIITGMIEQLRGNFTRTHSRYEINFPI